MTAATTVSVRRPGRSALFPEALPDPEGEAATAIGSLRFTVMLADRSKTIDLTKLSGRKALARTFAGTLWRACQVGGPAGSISTASAYANALRMFWRYLDAVSPHVVSLSDVSAACIDGFDAWMEESGLHPNHRLQRMSKVLNLLRLAEAAEPGHLPPDASRRLRQYPHEFSGGMNQRVVIALALAGEPDVLIADEPTTALDATIQAQVLDLIRDIRRETGMALVLISHDIGVVGDLCDRIAVMYAGRIVETAATQDLLTRPRHPYTQGLLAALPTLDGPRRRLTPIAGTVPAPAAIPPGCAFAPRCPAAVERCGRELPALVIAAQDQRAACLRLAELPPPMARTLPEAAPLRRLGVPA